MKNILILVLSVFAVACKPTASEKKSMNNPTAPTAFYVGTYTNVDSPQEGKSQGIYKYTIDNDGKLGRVGLAAEADNPSFLAMSFDGKYVVAASETDAHEGMGTVNSYEIIGDKLNKKSSSSSGGAHPCHVAINRDGQIVVANYTGGNVGLLAMSKKGTLSELLDVQQHTGHGTHQRQEAPHAHSSWFRPDDSGVISVDLGTNELISSRVEGNKFVKDKISKLQMKAEAGPRHIVFHPDGKSLYVLNELDNTVGLVKIAEDGDLQLGETVSMLPNDFTEFSKGADIHISEDGRFLYASNRGHDSIVIFAVNGATGTLKHITTESTRGIGPRNFQLAVNDRFLVVANEKSNSIVSFTRDSKTGLLSLVDKIDAPTPVSLLF
jgi:6-phosphogluconolactonase